MFHDESRYPDPETFNPDRFITQEGTLDPDVPNPEQFAFGFGRRLCPGRFIGAASVWLTMATILATFELEMPTDEHARKIEPSEECTTGLAVYVIFQFADHLCCLTICTIVTQYLSAASSSRARWTPKP